jgi:hypothetical protein
MEIADLCWLERRPARHASDEEVLNYRLHLLVENRFVAATAAALRKAAARAEHAHKQALSFTVPGSFNGRLFDCRLTVTASELGQAHWQSDFEHQLRGLCRTI